MKKQKFFSFFFLVLAAALFLPGLSCDTNIKKFGRDEGRLNPNDPARERFRLFIAVFSPDFPREVTAYGRAGSGQDFLQQCGFQGRACICELFNTPEGEDDPVISEGNNLEYDNRVNMFRCTLPDGVGINSVSHVRISNRAKTSISNIVFIKTTDPEEEDEEKRLGLRDLLAGVSLLEVKKYMNTVVLLII